MCLLLLLPVLCLQATPKGLTEAEAKKRLDEFGKHMHLCATVSYHVPLIAKGSRKRCSLGELLEVLQVDTFAAGFQPS